MKKFLLLIALTFCIRSHAANTAIDVAKEYPRSVAFIGDTLKEYTINPVDVHIQCGEQWGTYSRLTHHVLEAPATWQILYAPTDDMSLRNLEAILNTYELDSLKNNADSAIQKYRFTIGHEARHILHNHYLKSFIPSSIGWITAFATYNIVSQNGILNASWGERTKMVLLPLVPLVASGFFKLQLMRQYEQQADDNVKNDINILSGGFRLLKNHALFELAYPGLTGVADPMRIHPPSIKRLTAITKRIHRLDPNIACHLVTDFDSQRELELSRFHPELLRYTKKALLNKLGPDFD